MYASDTAQVRRALLLSGSIGRGHEMMARACAEVLDELGWSTRTRDSMTLLGGVGDEVSARISRRLMSTRGLFDALHFASLRTGGRVAMGMAALSNARVVPALRAELDRDPADLVLSVFATGAAAAATLATNQQATNQQTTSRPAADRKTVVLCTDACAHRLWVWPGTDLFLVTSEAAAESVRRYQPEAMIRVVPPPLRSAFATAPTQESARAHLGLPTGEPCLLMLDSGWGFGARVEAARRLAHAGVHVLAVTGRALDHGSPWTALARDEPRVQVFGSSDEVPLLMSAADLVLALPGATTCGEARALGTPLMLLDAMPGHGRDNLQQQLDLGDAYVCDASAASIADNTLATIRRGLPRRPRQNPRAWSEALRAALAEIGVHPASFRPAVSPTETGQPTQTVTPPTATPSVGRTRP